MNDCHYGFLCFYGLLTLAIFLHLFSCDSLFSHSSGFLYVFGLGNAFLAMLFVKVILVICFQCVGFLCNWLNADRSQNCEKIDRSIPSIFRLSVLIHKYCYTSDTKQVPPQLKFKNLLLLLLLCGDVASNPGPTSFGFVNCRSIRNKGPLLQDLIKRGDLDILGLVEMHIRPPEFSYTG